MKAILQEKYGAPEVALQCKEVPKPVPAYHQVLVKVRAASVNAKDWRGFTMPLFVVRFFGGGWSKPKDTTTGTDVAGVVEAVGEDVTRFKPGDEGVMPAAYTVEPLRESEIPEIGRLARAIWRGHYTTIIGAAQVEYMLQDKYTLDDLKPYLSAAERWFGCGARERRTRRLPAVLIVQLRGIEA